MTASSSHIVVIGSGLAGYGVLQRCDGVDLGALDAFVAVYAAEEPAVPGADTTPRGG